MIEDKELAGMIKMLGETSSMILEAKMTGVEFTGQKTMVRQYNNFLNGFQKANILPEGIFTSLENDVTVDELWMCYGQLAAYLKGMMEKSEDEKAEPSHHNVINVGKGTDVKELGELIRQAMPPWLRKLMEEGTTQEKESDDSGIDMNDPESRIAELGAQMQVLAERMHRSELSSDEIRKMADQMRQLGQQQAELARKHSTMRAKLSSEEKVE